VVNQTRLRRPSSLVLLGEHFAVQPFLEVPQLLLGTLGEDAPVPRQFRTKPRNDGEGVEEGELPSGMKVQSDSHRKVSQSA
jgi:hypothetical protein